MADCNSEEEENGGAKVCTRLSTLTVIVCSTYCLLNSVHYTVYIVQFTANSVMCKVKWYRVQSPI